MAIEEQENSLIKRTGKGLLWSGSATVLQTILNVISLAILGRLLTPSDYGVFSAALVIVAMGQTFSALGLGPAIIQRKTLSQAHIATATTMAIAAGAFLALLLWLLAPEVAALMRIPALRDVSRALSIMLAVLSLTTVNEALLSRKFRFRAISLVQIGCWTVATFLIAIPMAAFGYGYWALVFAYVADAIATLAVYLVLTRQEIVWPSFDRDAFRDIVSTALGFSITRVMNYGATFGDNFVVARLLGPANLGVYAWAYNLLAAPAAMFSNLNAQVIFPVMAQVQDQDKRLISASLKGTTLTATLMLPACTFVVLYAREIIAVLFGPRWTHAVIPFMIFGAAAYFRVGAKTFGSVVQAKGRSTTLATIQSIYAVSVIGGAVFGARWGVNGVCVMVTIAVFVNYVLFGVVSCRAIGMKPVQLLTVHYRPIALACAVGVVGFLLKYALSNASPIGLLAASIAVIGVPVLAGLYFRPYLILGSHGAEVLASLMNRPALKAGR